MVSASFIADMKNLGFYQEEGNTFNRTNRSVAYDNDCSDDERNDEFYEDRTDRFDNWARPIITKAKDIAKKHSVAITIETSAEYGSIDISVK